MSPPSTFRLPLAYRLFFLVIEPLSALVGAYFAHFQPLTYLRLTHPESMTGATATTTTTAAAVPPATGTVLSQLANLYLLFALNEALVLRATADRRVWRALLLGLLIADLGHLASSAGARGPGVYWMAWRWNAIDWGNVGFVYVGAAMRIAFLSGVGLG